MKQVIVNKGIFYISLLMLMSIYLLLSVSREMSFNRDYFYSTFLLTIISSYFFLKHKQKNNYLDFDTIFIALNIIIFFVPPFFYDSFIYRFLYLSFDFNHKYINYASIIALLGIQSYFIGSLIKQPNRHYNSAPKKYIIDTRPLTLIVICGVVLFVAMGGIAYYRNIYADSGDAGGGLVTHIKLLTTIAAVILITTEIYNYLLCSKYKIRIFALLSAVFLAVLLLFIGNRTGASQILLPALVLYTIYFKRIGVIKFVLFMVFGIVAMYIFQIVRSNEDVNLPKENMALVFVDLTVASRSIYAAMDYVDDYGFTYGKTMMSGVIGAIPFLASTVGDINDYGSAEVLTADSHQKLKTPRERRIGLGTTVIADGYLGFGIIGVMFSMFLIGWFANYMYSGAIKGDYYCMLIYAMLAANSVYLARAPLFYPLKFILWGCCLAFLSNNLYKLTRKQ